MRELLGVVVLLVCLWIIPLVVAQEEVPPGCGVAPEPALVYTRQPRFTDPILGLDGKVLYEDGAQWQDFYDGGQPDVFSETDVVIDDLRGNTSDIFNCTTDDKHICSAHEFRPSPDNLLGLFTVARADEYQTVMLTLRNLNFNATRYELWLFDFVTGEKTLLDNNARSGEWLSNDTIVFASNRTLAYPPFAVGGRDYKSKGLHIFRAKLEGKALGPAFNITPHAVSCLSPGVDPSGDVVSSCWNGFGDRGYKHTPMNQYWLEQYANNGTNHRVILGAHGSWFFKTRDYLTDVCAVDARNQPINCGVGYTQLRLPRSYVALRDNRYMWTNYYRTNHQGGCGVIFNSERNDAEGYSRSVDLPDVPYPSTDPGSARFMPSTYAATPFGNDADNEVRFHKNGKPMGKTCYPFPVPMTQGKFGFTMLRGVGYSVSTPAESNLRYTNGEPTSKREIRVAYVDVVTDPFDEAQSRCIAGCDDKWNAFDARFVANYQSLYGQPAPAEPLPILEGKESILRIVNAREGEIFKLTHTNAKPEDDCIFQGCADDDWKERITTIHIEQVLPWLTEPDRKGFFATRPYGRYLIQENGSVEIVLPAGMTYQLWGVDTNGEVVAKDNSLHFAVAGETVTCHGCHDAHSIKRAAELGDPVDAWEKLLEAAEIPEK
jgi:hypothetical protein